jgi:hypothetical protein
MDYSGVEVHQIPGELAQLTGPQAHRDRQDEQGLKPNGGVAVVVYAELRTACAAVHFC